jgi:primosomal protein N' (replication factor Y)
MFAEVIVDVSAYPIDRPFDYAVPQDLQPLIESGSRVKVPFGNRSVLGFVMNVKLDTDVPEDKQKEIHELLDIEPVFSEEMIALSEMDEAETLCYEMIH